jgi:hypothetical protein
VRSERIQIKPAALSDVPAAAQPRSSPDPALVPVGNEDGQFVGYVRRSDIEVPSSLDRYYATVNARTLWHVTDIDGKLVGYIAPDVPFVPLAVAQAPAFDIEKVRADRNGGCEDQIGDPTFRQEFPRCDDGSTGQ